jgi:hypothetical protein
LFGLDLNIDSPSRTVTAVPTAESLDASRPVRVCAIESSLRAQATKLYRLGIRGNLSRNTIAQIDID